MHDTPKYFTTIFMVTIYYSHIRPRETNFRGTMSDMILSINAFTKKGVELFKWKFWNNVFTYLITTLCDTHRASGSKSQPRKEQLMCVHSKNATYHKYLHITTKCAQYQVIWHWQWFYHPYPQCTGYVLCFFLCTLIKTFHAFHRNIFVQCIITMNCGISISNSMLLSLLAA